MTAVRDCPPPPAPQAHPPPVSPDDQSSPPRPPFPAPLIATITTVRVPGSTVRQSGTPRAFAQPVPGPQDATSLTLTRPARGLPGHGAPSRGPVREGVSDEHRGAPAFRRSLGDEAAGGFVEDDAVGAQFGELCGEEWEFVRPPLPECSWGRKRTDERTVLNGIVRKSRSGTAGGMCPTGMARGPRRARGFSGGL
ncbi:hypothetical protein E6R60_15340 [Streptomyces sp. A0642]|nr:hypothetical protein E6R60_15340 [Streptomyces sp. A0642]